MRAGLNCKDCHLLHPRKMLPTYGTGKIEYAKSCVCSKGRYHVPMVFSTFSMFMYYVCYNWTNSSCGTTT